MSAALALFAERGFHGTRVPDIAAQAGVAIGTIYRYFPTKEALVNAVFRERKEAYTAILAGAFSADGTAGERALVAWRRLVAWARSDPVGFRFLELHHHADYLDPESRNASERAHNVPLAFLEAAQQQGAVHTGLPSKAMLGLAWGALVGFVREMEADGFICTPETIDGAGKAVWRMMTGALDDRGT